MERRLSREQSVMSIHLGTAIYMEVQDLHYNMQILDKKNDRYGIESRTEIAQLSQSLEALRIQSEQIRTKARAGSVSTTSEAGSLQDGEFLPRVVKELRRELTSISSAKVAIVATQRVISSLNFEALPVRHEAVGNRFTGTFDWIYNIQSFRSWLTDESGIFWISGKPGSGKSTLMKFLADNAQTRDLLREWSKPHTITIAAHYFWNPGTTMQKSLPGLLQTLVFEILRKKSGLVRSICKSRYERASENIDIDTSPSQGWTMEELSAIIEALGQSKEDDGLRLCLFVDGLDEFDGDHVEVCKLLSSLAASTCIKICVSSRPWKFLLLLLQLSSR